MALDGKVAVVTGANSGIGEAVATELAASGARLLLVARDEQRLDAVRQAALAAGAGACEALAVDVAAPGASVEIVRDALRLGEGIDVLVPCAGIFNPESIWETSIDNFDAVLGINVRAPYELILHARPHLRRKASIVLISSILGSVGFPSASAYSASKGAIEMLVRSLARELAEREIRINAIAPGIIKTAINRDAIDGDPKYAAWLLERIPLGHIGVPEQVAPTVTFLASSASSYMTGAVIAVDGGWVAE